MSLASQPLVFIIDDDESVCRSLTRLIRAAGYQTESFDSAEVFLAREYYGGIGCILLDFQLPGLTGIDLQQALAAANYSLPIVFISGHGDIPITVRAMKQGAVDFLTKPFAEPELLAAIARAVEQCKLDRREEREIESIQQRLATLTPREREVMALVVSGRLNKQIAYELGVVEKTIKVHRARVMDKMQVTSLAELVRLAERIGIPRKKD
jgi:FixJ family two-component response regulator